MPGSLGANGMDFLGLTKRFPGLDFKRDELTSPADPRYNCIAWAAGTDRRWWSHLLPYYWPPNVAREETLEAYIGAFETLGYTVCETATPEGGYEKIALYAMPTREPTHAARQLADGRWTSKLGSLEDLTHRLEDLEGVNYGRVTVILRRPISPPTDS